MRTIVANTISAAASVGFTVVAVAASAPSAAATIALVPPAVVQTADRDLASAAGQRTALRRIDAAAQRVCDVTPGDHLAAESCRSQAAKTAAQGLDRMGAREQVAAR